MTDLPGIGPAAPHDIFTDNHRWGDMVDWNQSCLALHEQALAAIDRRQRVMPGRKRAQLVRDAKNIAQEVV